MLPVTGKPTAPRSPFIVAIAAGHVRPFSPVFALAYRRPHCLKSCRRFTVRYYTTRTKNPSQSLLTPLTPLRLVLRILLEVELSYYPTLHPTPRCAPLDFPAYTSPIRTSVSPGLPCALACIFSSTNSITATSMLLGGLPRSCRTASLTTSYASFASFPWELVAAHADEWEP